MKLKENKCKTIISVCIPAYNNVSTEFLLSLFGVLQYSMTKYDIRLHIHDEQPVAVSRDKLVDMAMADNPDYLFWMDSDNVMGVRTIEELIKSIEKTDADLMSGLYFSKTPPYYPVIRRYRSGGFWKIDNPPINKTFQIDGCGFGCCLVKADVFRKLEKPYFKFSYEKWGNKDIVLSEDLYFCRNLMKQEFKMYVDTGVISDHVGGKIDIKAFQSYALLRKSAEIDREELIKDIMEYTGENQEKVDLNIMQGPELIKKEWQEKNPSNPEEEKKFYKETKNYLYDLALYHQGNRRKFDLNLLEDIKKLFGGKCVKVLDFGAGIGINSIMMALVGHYVTMADLDSKSLDFAEFRFRKRNIPYKVWKTDIEEPPNEKFDVILAAEVFEHLCAEDLKKYVDILMKMKHKNTVVFIDAPFGRNAGGVENSHPMHYDKTKEHDELIKKLLYE